MKPALAQASSPATTLKAIGARGQTDWVFADDLITHDRGRWYAPGVEPPLRNIEVIRRQE